MATSGDRYLATSGDFFMATDNPSVETSLASLDVQPVRFALSLMSEGLPFAP